VPSEDLCALSYADASFDLVVTSDTLEHVPDVDAALREIPRVLHEFGADFPERCRATGFDLALHRDARNPALVTFVARRPA
jgi:ubiquinone/menaquinone biosynthesis C-methylase UbiE